MKPLLFSSSSVSIVVRGRKTSNSFMDDDLDGPGTGLGGSATSMVAFDDVGSGNEASDVELMFEKCLTPCYSTSNNSVLLLYNTC